MADVMKWFLPVESTHPSSTNEENKKPSSRQTWLHWTILSLILLLQAIAGVIIGLLPDLGMIFYMNLASKTFDYDKQQSYTYYQQVPQGFLIGMVLSIVLSILCLYSRKTRLTSLWILCTLATIGVGLAFFIFMGWLFGSDSYSGMQIVWFSSVLLPNPKNLNINIKDR